MDHALQAGISTVSWTPDNRNVIVKYDKRPEN